MPLKTKLLTTKHSARVLISALCVVSFLVAGCGDMRDMRDEARLKPYEASEFFQDGASARMYPEGTVARGSLHLDPLLDHGLVEGKFAKVYPFEITQDVLTRGRERYDIFCSVCHGKTGYGDGMVVQRGFKQPRALHSKRLRKMRPGEIFDIITKGRGAMPDYAHQIKAEDRWAIIAYIRALQASQNAGPDDVPANEKHQLTETQTHHEGEASH